MPRNRQHSLRRRPALVITAAALAAAALGSSLLASSAFASRTDAGPGHAAAARPAADKAPDTFTHPGVLVSKAQLDFVKDKVKAGSEPWKSAYDQMKSSDYASLERQAKPRETVECGPYSKPNLGCTDEREDAIAAYTDALVYYISGDKKYADKAIELMNAWSGTIKDHTNSNAPLQTGWAGSVWPRAGEIIRYTYDGWDKADVDSFGKMLTDVYLPKVENGSNSNGNWELSMTEAAIGIAVFTENKSAYDKAVEKFQGRVPAYTYLTSDGDTPKTAPGSGLEGRDAIVKYWQGQSDFRESGITQETCRDFVHTGYGLSAVSHIAETSRIQGKDLYPEVADRLRQGLGFQARYELGEQPPSWLCGGKLTKGLGPVTEVGYNALHNRMGYEMTNTQKLTEKQRPAGSNNLFVAWETLTHADNPK
jgi:hypothetical protein